MAEQLGRYVLERKLATGGMAEVFLAKQAGPERFERACVVKRLLPYLAEDPEFVGMFLDEARLAAQLSHPNIAPVFDFGRHENTFFIAMEYVIGADLRTLVRDWAERKQYLPLPAVIRIASQAASALEYAHTATDPNGAPLKIVHRDVSPPNILIGNSGVVKLIDFGIAKAAGDRQKTSAGVIKGKMAYMSPEQVLGKPLDGRSDLFSLGLVMFELLTNTQAVTGETHMDLFERIAHGPLPSLRQRRSGLPGDLVAMVERNLELDPRARYATAGELCMDLERLLTNLGQTVTPTDLAQLAAPYAPMASSPRIAVPIKLTETVATAAPAKSSGVRMPETRVNRPRSANPEAPRGKAASVPVLATNKGAPAPSALDPDLTAPAFPAQPETPPEAPDRTLPPHLMQVVEEGKAIDPATQPQLRSQTVTEKVRPVRRYVGLGLLIFGAALAAFESQNPAVQAAARQWWGRLTHR